MNCFVFLFTEVYNVASLFWILMLFELFLVILETTSFLVSLAKTLRLLDLNLPLTCAQRRRYLQKTNFFSKTNSTLIRDLFVSTYFFRCLYLLPLYFFILLVQPYSWFCFSVVFSCTFAVFLYFICVFVLVFTN
jgi:hypothetical protein